VEAAEIAREFVGMFGEDGRFFSQAGYVHFPPAPSQILHPYAHPEFSDFVFSGGCVANDSSAAAVVWVLDND
jgi:hypothetical protein